MLALQESFDGWQLQAFGSWPGDATLELRGKRFTLWAKAMHAWMRMIQLARDLNGARHRPARVQDGLDLRDDFWQLPQGLDLRSTVGHRANNLSGLALKAFILKLRGF